MSKKDLTGMEFTYFKVIGKDIERSDNKHVYWKCKCICGKEFSEQYGTIDEFDLAGIYGSTELFETDLEIFMEQNNITNRVIIIDGSIPKQTSLVDDLTSNLE